MKKVTLRDIVTLVIRAVFFFLFPAVFAAAFAGIRYLCRQIAAGELLQTVLFLTTLPALLGFTIVFGRFFCGYACAFGTYGDVLYAISAWVRKKRKKKPFHFPDSAGNRLKYGKYLVLAGIAALCLTGKTQIVAQASPWTVFSRLHALRLPSGEYGMGVLLFAAISVMMLFEERFFCRFLCPMGAVFSLMPVLPASAVKRERKNCVSGCAACRKSCPAGIEIADAAQGDSPAMGECFSCGKCVRVCPKGNVRAGAVTKERPGVWLLLLKVAILLGICAYFC